MEDTVDILPKSREYFRKFLNDHKNDFFQDMREYRVGPGTGYSYFYRSDELIQHLRNIYHNLDETFGNLTIPGNFTSPDQLVNTWKWFYEYIEEQEDLIKEIHDQLTVEAKEKYGKDFFDLLKSGMIYPLPFNGIVAIHEKVKDALRYTLSMEEVKKYLNEEKNKESDGSKSIKDENTIHNSFDIAIITAIYKPEQRQVREILNNIKPYKIADDPTAYFTGELENNKGKTLQVVFASDDKMGMSAASNLSTKLLLHFKPKYLVMLGICAGIEGKVKTGDIIITECAWDYGSGKHEKIKIAKNKYKEVFKPYINQNQLDVQLESKLKLLVDENKYVDDIENNWNNTRKQISEKLKAVIGPFASGSAVIANEDIVSEINSHHGKLLGFDMEAYSVFNACRYTSYNKTKPIVIKSVSDFGDSNKGNADKDLHQEYAAFTSAQFFRMFAINDLDI
jgi:nucleoside phosphorylase